MARKLPQNVQLCTRGTTHLSLQTHTSLQKFLTRSRSCWLTLDRLSPRPPLACSPLNESKEFEHTEMFMFTQPGHTVSMPHLLSITKKCNEPIIGMYSL